MNRLFNKINKILNPINKKEELKQFFINRGKDRCLRCNRKLTDPNSMIKGYGKVCYEKTFNNNQLKLINT